VIRGFHVNDPGLLTTVQDLGRPHAMASGVPAGGAMDRFAHIAANLLVENDRSAATLECTWSGPSLVAEQRCVVAITGADLDPRVNGAEAPMWTSVELDEGDQLSFGRRRGGVRTYVAVRGGFGGDRWLGSLSTNLMTGRGGVHGRGLAAGDVLTVGESEWAATPGRTLAGDLRPRYEDHILYAIAGPHEAAGLFDAAFALSHDSNRMGYRLEGPTLRSPTVEILSFALIAGAVQLPSGGQPILLMADHQTAGGYPVVAVVVSASMPIAAQLAPGDELRVVETSIEEALRQRSAQRSWLDSLTS
jgi:antagonist of KipI